MPTHRQNVLKRLGLPSDSNLNIEELADITGVAEDILQEVYNRGVGAHANLKSVRLKKDFSKNPDTKKYPRSARLSKEQWGYARIYSFLDGGTTWKTTDSDLARELIARKKN